MQTQVLTANEGIDAAVALLQKGEIVALPTETVYGLGADALNSIAVAKIFEAKERPHFDPLIVHLPDRDSLGRIAFAAGRDQKLVSALIERFWPGPLTIVLPKQPAVPDITTAGLETVAVRMSVHPVFAQICRAVGPIAAPSANCFGRISPTTARHVEEELGGRIPLIVDAGPTQHGIESTIVAVSEGKIDILRRGPVTREQLREFGEVQLAAGEKIIAPGQLPSHYAPKKPLMLKDDVNEAELEPGMRYGLLAWKTSFSGDSPVADSGRRRLESRGSFRPRVVRRLSENHDLREAAANLFRYLRELDADPNVDVIIAERVPEQGLGAAVMDRLQRAAAHFSHTPVPQQ